MDIARYIEKIWQEVLEINSRIAHDHSFIQLGGQSISAMRIVSRISEIFSVDIKIKTFFALKTISRVASYIESKRGTQQKNLVEVRDVHRSQWFNEKISQIKYYHYNVCVYEIVCTESTDTLLQAIKSFFLEHIPLDYLQKLFFQTLYT